jgi:hypothetical protein
LLTHFGESLDLLSMGLCFTGVVSLALVAGDNLLERNLDFLAVDLDGGCLWNCRGGVFAFLAILRLVVPLAFLGLVVLGSRLLGGSSPWS